MSKGRMEAFSDGVFAIIITIMVLDLKVPQSGNFAALIGTLPLFLSYVLSFVFVGLYWNNHHHLLQATEHISGGVLWANLHLLFWLTLAPFVTAWIGQNYKAVAPAAVYGAVLFCAGMAYYILTRSLLAHHSKDSRLARAVGKDVKGQMSVVIYAVGIALAFWRVWAADVCYVLVALMWFVPDPRIERVVHGDGV